MVPMMHLEAMEPLMQRLGRHYGWILLDGIHREPRTERCADTGIHVCSRLELVNIALRCILNVLGL